MTLSELLSELKNRKVQLWAEGDRLRYKAPKGSLSPELLGQIRLNKDEILTTLMGAQVKTRGDRLHLVPLDRRQSIPLSPSQQRIWFLQQLEPDNSTYKISRTLRLRGPLDVDALQQAFTTILKRHESLRTRFITTNDVPIQVIDPFSDYELPLIHTSEDQLISLLRKESRRPFDLARDLMLRANLFRLQAEEHILQMVIHHIVTDGWSMGVLRRELTILYEVYTQKQTNPLPELPIQYADYSEWQRQRLSGSLLQTQLDYWTKKLEGIPPLLKLPTDHPRPARSSNRGKKLTFNISQPLTQSLQTLSRREDATLFMTLLAAFNTLLYRYTQEEDIAVGSPIANRNLPELENLIGLFLNTLVLRTDLSGSPTFSQLLNRVKITALEAYTHQDVPFERLLDTLQPSRTLSSSPWFQVMFILQNPSRSGYQFRNLSTQVEYLRGETAKYDLTLTLRERTDGLRGTFEYRTDLFEAVTIERMAGHFQTLLEGIVDNPDTPITNLPMLTPVERHRLLMVSNPIPKALPQKQCIHQLFTAQANRTPEAIALIAQNEQLTYRQVNERANQLAHYLHRFGVGPDVLVGMYVDRSIEMVVILLGILKAGGAYVSLDPTYPQERFDMILADAQPQVLVTLQPLRDKLSTANIPVVCLDADWQNIAHYPSESPANSVRRNHLAYVIYTSGSTGVPKGVMIEHQALVNFTTAAISAYHLSARDRVLQFASLNFDAAVEEIFPCLCCGATLVLRSNDMISSPVHFMDQCQRLQLTVLDLPTAYWHHLAAELPATQCLLPDSLRLVIIGGEQALLDQLHSWQDWVLAKSLAHGTHREPPQLVNTYGPTEATVVATSYRIPFAHSKQFTTVPIGQGFANAQVYLLDPNLQPVPIGIAGEVYIGGCGLARGYLHRPELTQQRFIPHPFIAGQRLYKTGDLAIRRLDGNLIFLERRDDQVKIRGFRIELGEVETALSQHPTVQQCKVMAREDVSGNRCLAGYVVAAGPDTASGHDLHQWLEQRLPDYMIPAAFIPLPSLPLTPSGKVDRSALPKPKATDLQGSALHVSPTTLLEKQLADIWTDLLNLDQVGVYDNFFELGGHSLLAAQVIGRIQQRFQVHLPLSLMFEAPTIHAIASQFSTAQAQIPAPDSLLVLLRQGHSLSQPLFLIHDADGDVSLYANLALKMRDDRTIYGIKPRAIDGIPLVHSRIEAIAADYRKQIQTLQPQGPYLIGGLCIGGTLAFEVALQLQQAGETVALVALLDAYDCKAKRRPEYRTRANRARTRSEHLSTVLTTSGKGILKWLKVTKKVLGFEKYLMLRKISKKILKYRIWLFRQFYEGGNQPVPKLLQGLSVRKVLKFAMRDYCPRDQYNGQVLLIKASMGMTPEDPPHAVIFEDPLFGWGHRVTQEIQVQQVAFGHNSMLSAEYVDELADILTQVITSALESA